MNTEDIMRNGYLPKELPPCFSSDTFASASSSLQRPTSRAWTTPTALNLARPGSLRRRLSIPNPFSQLLLAEKMVTNWTTLDAHFAQSRLGLSAPIPNPGKGRALTFRSGWENRVGERARRMNRGRYVLVSDVSEFYSSIYTHSLEWALHGKAQSKRRVKGSSGGKPLGAELDDAVRPLQDGQTKGLPIGPDTSLALSEIVMTAVDQRLEAQNSSIANFGWRWIDDLEVFTSTQSEAEDILVMWQSALASFELIANSLKTSIVEGPIPVEDAWRTTMAQTRVRRDSDAVCSNDLYSYFSRAFDLSRQYKTDSVLSYAVSSARQFVGMGKRTSAALQELALASVIVDPSSLRYGTWVIELLNRAGAEVDRDRLQGTLNDVCEYHSRREHGSEVAWALYAIRRFGLKLSSDAAFGISRMEDNCSLIMLFDLVDHGQVDSVPDMTDVVSRAEAEGVETSEDWLLAHECARREWANGKYLSTQDGWRELLKDDIGFFSTAPQAKQPAGAATAPVATTTDQTDLLTSVLPSAGGAGTPPASKAGTKASLTNYGAHAPQDEGPGPELSEHDIGEGPDDESEASSDDEKWMPVPAQPVEGARSLFAPG